MARAIGGSKFLVLVTMERERGISQELYSRLATAIAEAGGSVNSVARVRKRSSKTIGPSPARIAVTIQAPNQHHRLIANRVSALDGVRRALIVYGQDARAPRIAGGTRLPISGGPDVTDE
jgi:hypothetical protein